MTLPPPPARPASPVRLTPVPALDGVRAIAVSLVLLFHGGHLDGGFLGVDVFFVLSGYLITALLLDAPSSPVGVGLRAFWVRRARRLLPGLVLVLGATLLAIAILHGADDFLANRDEATSSLLYVSNWRAVTTAAPYLTVFQHTWSLSIEAQFYLVWPLVVAGARLIGRPTTDTAVRRVLALALGGAAISTVAMAVLHGGPESIPRVYFGTDTRAAPILLGAALAAAMRVGLLDRVPRRAWPAVGVVGVVGVAWLVAVLRRPDDALYRGGFATLGICAAAVVASLTMGTGPLARVLALPPLRWLGLISYGVYLWHWPVFYLFGPDRAHLSGWPLFTAQCAITLTIATVSYVAVEQPLRRPRPRR